MDPFPEEKQKNIRDDFHRNRRNFERLNKELEYRRMKDLANQQTNFPGMNMEKYLNKEYLDSLVAEMDKRKAEKEAEEEKNRCRSCGKKRTGYSERIGLPVVDNCCTDCMHGILNVFFEDFLKGKAKNDANFCQSCFSHIDACRCPETEAIKKLKK